MISQPFALIAHAINDVNHDENLGGFINARTLDPKVIRDFIRSNELAEAREQKKIEIKTNLKYSKYAIATSTVAVNDNYFLRVNMFFDKLSATPGLLDLFSMLLEKIEAYARCVPGIVSESKEKYSAFLLDMLSKKLPDPALVRMRV